MVVLHFSHLNMIDLWAKDMGQIVMIFYGLYWMHILDCILLHLIAQVEFVFLILFIFIFGLGFYKELKYLLWFILISLIGSHMSQNKNVFKFCFLVCSGPLWLAYHQKFINPNPFFPQTKLIVFAPYMLGKT
jgi:hypothetical protein